MNNSGLYSSFDDQAAVSTDVLVKYTYFGDANLDGQVDGSDYTKIDNGFNNHLIGWSNGDFNYDGVIDGSDYTLIDNAFNTQGTSLAAVIAPNLPAVRSASVRLRSLDIHVEHTVSNFSNTPFTEQSFQTLTSSIDADEIVIGADNYGLKRRRKSSLLIAEER
jgi:hypothetical protein